MEFRPFGLDEYDGKDCRCWVCRHGEPDVDFEYDNAVDRELEDSQ